MTCICCGLTNPDVRAVIPSQPLCGYCVEWCDRTLCKRVWRARTGIRPVVINTCNCAADHDHTQDT